MTAPWEQTTQDAGHMVTADTLMTDSSNISTLPASEQQPNISNISRCTVGQSPGCPACEAELRSGQTMVRGPNAALKCFLIQPVKLKEILLFLMFFF